MKKIIILFCGIAITATAFAQVKSNTSMIRNSASVKQNVALAAINTNRDSVEISQLYEAYQIADAEANNKLQLLIAKMKAVSDKKNNGGEMGIVQLQNLTSQRGTLLKMVTDIMNNLNQSSSNIIPNIR
jgi:parvulin-like peptidyl-prolyl isomerase